MDCLKNRKGFTPPFPFDKIPPLKQKSTKPLIQAQRKTFCVKGYKIFIIKCDNDTFKNFITLAAYTNCQNEEVYALKLQDVSSEKIEMIEAKTKTGLGVVQFNSRSPRLLHGYQQTNSDECHFSCFASTNEAKVLTPLFRALVA